MEKIKKKKSGKIFGCENAAAAKARCMYGDRLRYEDYMQLASCATVGEAASFLHSKKRYSNVLLTDSSVSSLHREQIEYMLEKRKYGDYIKLSAYLKGGGEYVKWYLCAERDIALLMRAVAGLNNDGIDESFHILISDLDKESKIRISELSNAKCYDDIIKASEDSIYVEILKKYHPSDDEEIDIVHLENDIWNLVFDILHVKSREFTTKEEHRQLREFFKTYIDAKNISTIARLRSFSGADSKYINSLMLSHGFINEKKLAKIIDNPEDAQAALRNTGYSKNVFSNADACLSVCAEKCRKYIRISTYPAVTVLCYMYLLGIELGNIIKIVEGIRYSMPQESILAMIITEE